jgi:UDP-2-acetamido-3-amino-2,3-dideoxy-glucuronate N-acetyltransferase
MTNAFFAHPTACVDSPHHIGEGTRIWHFCHIMPEARIGQGCVLGQNVYVGSQAIIGNRVKIQNNVSVYDQVVIEDDAFIGPSAVFTNVLNPRSAIERKNEYRKTIIGVGVSIGANATIICGVTIGKYAFIGAGAVVTKDVPPFALMVGVPGKVTGYMCACGLRLPHFSSQGWAQCPACQKQYQSKESTVQLIED